MDSFLIPPVLAFCKHTVIFSKSFHGIYGIWNLLKVSMRPGSIVHVVD